MREDIGMAATLAAKTVGVMGSGTDEHDALAQPIGELLATLDVNLLTGGGGGVMRSVSRAYVRHRRGRGISLGILPRASDADRGTPSPGYPNEFVELAIRTHLPYSGRQGTHNLSRNHINVLSCDAIVVLPGGDGTASEVSLALRYGTPAIVYAREPSLVGHFPDGVQRAARLEDVRRFLCEHLFP